MLMLPDPVEEPEAEEESVDEAVLEPVGEEEAVLLPLIIEEEAEAVWLPLGAVEEACGVEESADGRFLIAECFRGGEEGSVGAKIRHTVRPTSEPAAPVRLETAPAVAYIFRKVSVE